MVIKQSFYLSDESNIPKALEITGLSLDELVMIVGKFNKNSWRNGQIRGEVVEFLDGKVIIRHHFTKKKLWECDLNLEFYNDLFVEDSF